MKLSKRASEEELMPQAVGAWAESYQAAKKAKNAMLAIPYIPNDVINDCFDKLNTQFERIFNVLRNSRRTKYTNEPF